MKTIAVLGWVAAAAALLAVFVLLARPPVVVSPPVPPFVAEGHPELRGVRTVGVVISGKGVPADVARRVADELRAGGLEVVDEPPDGRKADTPVNASFNLTLRASPIPRTSRLLLSSEAIVKGEAVVPHGGNPVRAEVVLWLGIHAAAADEPAVEKGMVEVAGQHARKFAGDVRKANGSAEQPAGE